MMSSYTKFVTIIIRRLIFLSIIIIIDIMDDMYVKTKPPSTLGIYITINSAVEFSSYTVSV